MIRASLAALSVAGLLGATPALAADTVDFADPVIDPVVEAAPVRSVLLGIGGGFAPAYEGSDEYVVFPFPIFSYNSGAEGPRRFEFRAVDDIRLHVLRFNGFSAGPIAGYSFGRDENVDDVLNGLGDIEGGFVGGVFAAYDFRVSPNATVGVDVGVSHQFSGDPLDPNVPGNAAFDADYGYEVDFGASANLRLSPRASLALRVGAVYADEDYMNTHFGINAAQAANSVAGLAAFDADAGIKNVYGNANLAFDVTERVQVRAGLGYSRLLGDAADSPVSVSDNQFSGSLGVGYRFRF